MKLAKIQFMLVSVLLPESPDPRLTTDVQHSAPSFAGARPPTLAYSWSGMVTNVYNSVDFYNPGLV